MVEVFIYLVLDVLGKGIGMWFYIELFVCLKIEEVYLVFVGIVLLNLVLMVIYKKVGFVEMGVLYEVGYKFSKYWDVVWLEKCI